MRDSRDKTREQRRVSTAVSIRARCAASSNLICVRGYPKVPLVPLRVALDHREDCVLWRWVMRRAVWNADSPSGMRAEHERVKKRTSVAIEPARNSPWLRDTRGRAAPGSVGERIDSITTRATRRTEGKRAPESSHSGIRNRFDDGMKAGSIHGHAIANPEQSRKKTRNTVKPQQKATDDVHSDSGANTRKK